MTLSEYLETQNMTAHRFAGMSGINHTTIGRLLAGQVPRVATAQKIHDITGGAVTLEDWTKP